MNAGGCDRLSELSDDLLRRILHFAPIKKAASTTALSRRWRVPLWLSSSAVYLETGFDNSARFFNRYDDIITAAAVALDTADARVSRLTMRHSKVSVVGYGYTDLVGEVLSHKGARHVEELQLVAEDPRDYYHYCSPKGLYEVTLDSLPLETLRVLQLTNCMGVIYHRDHALLPRLSSLRLSYCRQHLASLQRIIDDAPALAAVRLESVIIDATAEKGKVATPRRLRCPAANMLVLESCTWEENQGRSFSGDYYKNTVDVDEIIAPRLRCFRYEGAHCSFTFTPRPNELEQVDLHLFGYSRKKDRHLENFWRFTRSFTSTREMRLRVSSIQDIAVLSEAWRVELLPAFHRLERLEVQGLHWTRGTTETVTAILNLLRCCPAVSAFRINLTTMDKNTSHNKKEVRTRVPQGSGLQISAMLGPSNFYKCLQSSLRGVGLKFRLEQSDCLGEKLIKFFAEKAMVLEEMCIDSGDKKLCEQMKPKIEKWNSNRRKLGATSFVILPFKSRLYQERKI